MTTYFHDEQPIDPDDPASLAILVRLHAERARLRCPCVVPGPSMYLARAGDRVIVKRLPDSGGEHSPSCDSYEPPAELSGRGEVAGSAIQEDADAGKTRLRLGFSLARTGARVSDDEQEQKGGTAEDGSKDAATAKAQRSKLTLQALVHFLWDEARLNVWAPAMRGKRSWRVVHRHLLQAAKGKGTSTTTLSESLYIPEPFVADDKGDIAARRDGHLAGFKVGKGGKGRLGLLVGEVKALEPSRFGGKVVVKQVPDLPFMLPKDLHAAITKKFDTALGLWEAIPDSHLLIVATFAVSSAGFPELQEAALLNFDGQWLPFESRHEHQLLDACQTADRRLVKGMRYNLPPTKPLASVVLTDCRPIPVAMYVLPLDATDAYRTELDELCGSSKLAAWVWDIEQARPALPVLAGDGQGPDGDGS